MGQTHDCSVRSGPGRHYRCAERHDQIRTTPARSQGNTRTQYWRSLYPLYSPVALMSYEKCFFSSSGTCANGTSAMSKMRSFYKNAGRVSRSSRWRRKLATHLFLC